MVGVVMGMRSDGGVGRIRVLGRGDAVGVGGHVGVAACDGANDIGLGLLAMANDRGGCQAKDDGAMLCVVFHSI